MKADAAMEHQNNWFPARKLGIRLLPGGDYGFPFIHWPQRPGLGAFVRHLGFTPIDALVASTKLGGEIMGMGHELGQVKSGYLADLLVVRGDPDGCRDIVIRRIFAIKDGLHGPSAVVH
jgi:imidazolonepropionase-like amidohydrolase